MHSELIYSMFNPEHNVYNTWMPTFHDATNTMALKCYTIPEFKVRLTRGKMTTLIFLSTL